MVLKNVIQVFVRTPQYTKVLGSYQNHVLLRQADFDIVLEDESRILQRCPYSLFPFNPSVVPDNAGPAPAVSKI